jgi:hypothetical protein
MTIKHTPRARYARPTEQVQALMTKTGLVEFVTGPTDPRLEFIGQGMGPEFIARVAALCEPTDAGGLRLAVPLPEAVTKLAEPSGIRPGAFADLVRISGLRVSQVSAALNQNATDFYQMKYGQGRHRPSPELCDKLRAMAIAYGQTFGNNTGPGSALILYAAALLNAAQGVLDAPGDAEALGYLRHAVATINAGKRLVRRGPKLRQKPAAKK